jgi:RNA recognition motif-containing protein
MIDDPKNNPNIVGDPYKTLFLHNMDYKTDEKKIKREFEMYGPIKKVTVIRDNKEKSRGYAFVEYEHKSDFKNAYKKSDKKRIDDSRVSVDYERGRTEKNWKPRRLGGGKGESRPLPLWLEKEINQIREMYPEIVQKYKSVKPLISRIKSKEFDIKSPTKHTSSLYNTELINSNLRKKRQRDEIENEKVINREKEDGEIY